MGSDGTGAEGRLDPRFSARFQRGALPAEVEREPAQTSADRREAEREDRREAEREVEREAEREELEAAFAADTRTDTRAARDAAHPGAPADPASVPPAVDESRALAFVRGCAIGCLVLVALLLAGAVAAQMSVTSLSDREWVYFLSQFAFIAAPSLFVLGIAAFIFVGYRRRLAPTPPPSERTPR